MTTTESKSDGKGLAKGTLGLFGSTVMGLASTAPVYSLVATLGACGSSGSTADRGKTTTAVSGATAADSTASGFDPAAYAQVKADLKASGATFPQNYYNAAIDTFTSVLPGIGIAYGGGG